MIKYLLIIFLFINYSVFSQEPTGFPTQTNTGWQQWGYQQSTKGTIIATRDTNWTPRYLFTIIGWPHSGVDTAYWMWNGIKWNKLTTAGDVINLHANNGLYILSNNIVLGTSLDNSLDTNVIIRYKANKYVGAINNGIYISNINEDSVGWTPTSTITGPLSFQPEGMHINMLYAEKNNDTLMNVYGGPFATNEEISYDSVGVNRYKQPGGATIFIPYTGIHAGNRIFLPRDSVNILVGANGGQGSEFFGDWAIGDSWGYNAYTYQTRYPGYPLAVNNMQIDLQRNISRGRKRQLTGVGITSFFSNYKDYQGNINGSTIQDSAYHSKIYGYYAAGEREGDFTVDTLTASKAYILGISTNDTVIGFNAAPQWTRSNSVKNGYGFVSTGQFDYNHFKGYFKVGGSMPSTSNTQVFRLQVDSTMRIGGDLGSSGYITKRWTQSGITPSNYASRTRPTGESLLLEYSFDSATNIIPSLIAANQTYVSFSADSFQIVRAFNSGLGASAASFGLLVRKKTGYADTTTFSGGTTPFNAPAPLNTRMDFSGTAASGQEVIGTGWWSAFNPTFQFSAFNQVQNAIWVNVGCGQFSPGTSITSAYGIYINAFGGSTTYTNKYAIYQAGTVDSVILNGPIRTPNLVAKTDTTSYKPIVIDANGNVSKFSFWPGSGGAVTSVSNSDGSLTISPTTGSVVGSINLAHSNAFTVSQSITSSSQVGLQVNMSNTADGTYAINLNRSSTAVENAFNYSTNGVAQYFIGQNNDPSNDFDFYSWVPNKFAFVIDGTTVDIKFGNSLNALIIKNDGSFVTLASLDTDNTPPTPSGTTKMVITDANGQLSFANLPLSSLNSLTAATQTFATGTSGSDFNISSATSTHTFNIPDAGTSARGVVTTTSQTLGGKKTFNDGAIVTTQTAVSGTSLVVSGDRTLGTAPGISGIGMQLASFTYTNTEASTTESGGQNFHLVNTPTLTSSNAVTYSGDVSTIRFVGAPIAGGSSTISHPWNIFANDVNYFQTLASGLNEQSGDATLGNGSNVVYNGAGGNTFTLPSLSTHPGKMYYIKNAGGGNLTIARGGSDNIYSTSSVTSITVTAGSAVILVAGTSFWYQE